MQSGRHGCFSHRLGPSLSVMLPTPSTRKLEHGDMATIRLAPLTTWIEKLHPKISRAARGACPCNSLENLSQCPEHCTPAGLVNKPCKRSEGSLHRQDPEKRLIVAVHGRNTKYRLHQSYFDAFMLICRCIHVVVSMNVAL